MKTDRSTNKVCFVTHLFRRQRKSKLQARALVESVSNEVLSTSEVLEFHWSPIVHWTGRPGSPKWITRNVQCSTGLDELNLMKEWLTEPYSFICLMFLLRTILLIRMNFVALELLWKNDALWHISYLAIVSEIVIFSIETEYIRTWSFQN